MEENVLVNDKRAAGIRLLLVLLFVIWSNSFTAIKYLRITFSPMELTLARFLPVSLLYIGYIAASGKRARSALELLRKAPLRLISMGILGVAGYNFFLYVGQSEIKPGAAALLTTLAPLFTLILAIIFLREKMRWKKIAGILIAFAGLYFVISFGRVGMGQVTVISNSDVRYALITSLAPLCWSIYTILGKELLIENPPFLVTAVPIIIGTIPLLVNLDGSFTGKILDLGSTGWIALFYLSALCTIVGFGIWNFSLKRLSATTVSSFIYLNPPFAALFGSLLFGEEVTPYFLVGSAVVIAGLYLAQTGNRPGGLNGPGNRSR